MRALLLILLLALAIPSDATIVCNGDSNTQANWQTYFPDGAADGWCERLGASLGETTINRGVVASGIVDSTAQFGGLPLWGGYYIDRQIVGIDPFGTLDQATQNFLGQQILTPFPAADVTILALGTNDVTYGSSASTIIAAIKKYRKKLLAAGSNVYVATIPPRFTATGELQTLDAVVRDVNDRIRGNFPVRHIEFYYGFTAADFTSDGIHLTAAGQAKRAAAAQAALQ